MENYKLMTKTEYDKIPKRELEKIPEVENDDIPKTDHDNTPRTEMDKKVKFNIGKNINNEMLISLVHERHGLWNIHNKEFADRNANRKLWQEIASAMDSTCDVVKGRWTNLRDNYRKDYARVAKSPSARSPKWKYFELLSFLKDTHHVPRNINGNGGSPETALNYCDSADYETLLNTYDVETIRKRNEKCNSTDVSTSRTNRATREGKWRYEEDEDYFFMLSLLPHLRDLPKNRKLAVRTKLQQVLLEEEERSTS